MAELLKMGGFESRDNATIFIFDLFKVIDFKLIILQFINFSLQLFLVCHGLFWVVLKRGFALLSKMRKRFYP